MENINIIQDIIPLGNKCRPGTVRKKSWIVIHETGNSRPTAGAKNHAIYLKNLAKQNNTYLSWHYSVDDKSIYQHIPDEEVSWNAGDGQKANGGNMAGISIEICVNSDSNFNKAIENAASLVKHLLKKHKLPISAVKQHFDFNRKNCPERIRRNGLWLKFLDMCNN